ncbi:hypothetical protein MHYP_G00116720 [Metynnis hypsauchen]
MLGSLVLIWIFILLFFLFVRIQRPKNFPPGPLPVPLFGNLFELNITNPLKDFKRLAERYGNVYSLYFGARPAVVLTGLKAVKEALVTNGVDFSGRPQNLLVSDAADGKGIILVDYGTTWKEHRRFALMSLRNFGMGKQSMEDRILGETEHLVARLEKSAGGFVNPQTLFHDAASNIIYLVLFGTRYDYEDNNHKVYVRCFTENTKITNGPWGMIYDTLPMLRSLPLPFRKVFKNFQTVEKMVLNMISKHKTTRVPGEPRDFVDCYLDELEKGTFVIANLASVLSEEGQWKFPHEFNPANFLNEQGQFEKPEAFLPFSAGPRMCLGEGLARMELFLILVTLLRQFQFFWPEDAGDPDFTPLFGVTLTPKPYRMGVRLRQPATKM